MAALILDPNVDDCAMAIRGEGAWLEDAAGKRRDLCVAEGRTLSEMTGMIS